MLRTLFSLCAVCLVFVSLTWCVALGPDGQRETDSKVPVIEVKAKHVLKFKEKPYSFSFSHDGKRFAANDGSCAVVWDTATWQQIVVHTEVNKQLVHGVRLSPDGGFLAFTTGSSYEIHLLDVASGKVLRTLTGQDGNIYPTFSPNGKIIATTNHQNGVRLWDVGTGMALGNFSSNIKKIQSIAFSQDSASLAVATERGVVHFLDVKNGKEIRQFSPADPALKSAADLAFSPDGHYMALAAHRTNAITVWDMYTAKLCWQLEWPESRPFIEEQRRNPGLIVSNPGIWALAFTADNRSLLVACADDRIRAWEMSTGRLRYQVEQSVGYLAIAQAGRLIATFRGEPESRDVSILDFPTCMLPRLSSTRCNLEKAWSDLDANDAGEAYQRMGELIACEEGALPFLDKRLPTAESVNSSILEGLIRDLDDDLFEIRERARQRLASLGEIPKSALTEALARKPSSEARRQIKALLDVLEAPPTGERLRQLRAVEILERIDSPDSHHVLTRLAGGNPTALLTQQAKSALKRLNSH